LDAAAKIDWAVAVDSRRLIPVPLDEILRPLMPVRELIRAWLSRQDSAAFPVRESVDQICGHPGYFFLVAPAFAQLHPDLVDIVEGHIMARPDAKIFYGDDAVASPDGRSCRVHCKPQLNRALLFAQDYIGFPLIIRSDLLCADGVTPDIDDEAFWFELCLNAVAADSAFDRIPQTLMMTRSHRAQAGVKHRLAALRRAFPEFIFSEDVHEHCIRAARIYKDHPEITIIVPTNRSRNQGQAGSDDGKPHISSLLRSISISTWPKEKITLLIGDDLGIDGFYKQFDLPCAMTVVDTARPPGEKFNYARKINTLWRMADTEFIIILNDDIVIDAPDWIEALYTFGLEEDVGGVGARLLFPDGDIQHAGMVGGIYGVFAHTWYKCEDTAPTYEDWGVVHRDVSAVTGAVFATRKSVLEAVNGLDESFALDFNDVDLCLKMQMLGYRIVYAPHARMTHHESASRGAQFAPGADISLFLSRWRDCIRDDPMYSPQLGRSDSNVSALPFAAAAFGMST
jgi:O-antigen biosynthesis protein